MSWDGAGRKWRGGGVGVSRGDAEGNWRWWARLVIVWVVHEGSGDEEVVLGFLGVMQGGNLRLSEVGFDLGDAGSRDRWRGVQAGWQW